jgi:phage tail-like protein
VADATPPLVRAFRFRVRLLRSPAVVSGRQPAAGRGPVPTGRALGDGGFQECNGLEIQTDVGELLEGGRNGGVIRQVGRAKYTDLVLKRGMFFSPGRLADPELWRWLQDVARGVRPVERYDGIVEVMDAGETVVARWVFDRGLPARIVGPQLDALNGQVALEQLTIAHEGLRLVGGAP